MGEGHEGPYIVECELAVGYEGPEIGGLLPIMGLNGDKKPSWMFWPKCVRSQSEGWYSKLRRVFGVDIPLPNFASV